MIQKKLIEMNPGSSITVNGFYVFKYSDGTFAVAGSRLDLAFATHIIERKTDAITGNFD